MGYFPHEFTATILRHFLVVDEMLTSAILFLFSLVNALSDRRANGLIAV